MARVEVIGAATLYLGDCRDILPALKRADAVVTDPPYGQGYDPSYHSGSFRVLSDPRSGRHSRLTNNHFSPVIGDSTPFDPAPTIASAQQAIIWGAHKFADRLPEGSWLVWDKVPTGKVRDQGDGEAAWFSVQGKPLRIFRLLWDGLCVGSQAKHEVTAKQKRVHPTQKPVALMEWCLSFLPDAQTILDPYMGSGSTGVACMRQGRRFIGIEVDPAYFETARRRIEDAQRQADMFVTLPPAEDPADVQMAELFREPEA